MITSKNKKAILLGETMKIVIAVLCLILLVYLAVSLSGILIGKHTLEQGRSTLNAIAGKLATLEEGGKLDYLITSPATWRVVSYPDYRELCICPVGGDYNAQRDLCQKQGACKTLSYQTKILLKCSLENCIDITGITNVNLMRKENTYFIYNADTKPEDLQKAIDDATKSNAAVTQ